MNWLEERVNECEKLFGSSVGDSYEGDTIIMHFSKE
jgi:hypothetical protein